MRITLLIFLLITVSLESMGQRWRNAKIVLPNSDTLKGEARLVNNRDLYFKQDKNAEATKFSYLDAQAVYFEDERFISTHFTNTKNSNGKILFDSLFAKVLVSGDIELYHKNNNANRQNPETFLIKKNGSDAVELISITTIISKNGGGYSFKYEPYRNLLNEMFKDCPSLKLSDRQDIYSEKRMTAFTRKYMECRGLKSTFTHSSNKKVGIAVTAGIDVSSVSFSTEIPYNFYYLAPSGTSHSTAPYLGVQFWIPVSRSERFKIIGETQYRYQSYEINTVAPWGTESSKTNLSLGYLRLNGILNYSFPLIQRLHLDVLAGYGHGIAISKNYSRTYTNNAGSYQDNQFSFRSAEGCLLVGASLFFNEKLGITIRNEMGLGSISNYVQVSSSTNHMTYGLVYKLKPKK